jgi:ethanolamine ammonia-lyase small subunit
MMDQKQIEEIVRSVMASMGQPQTAAAAPEATVTKCASRCEVAAESCALDLGSPEAKGWIGVQQPHRAEVLAELKRSTAARVYRPRRSASAHPRAAALPRRPLALQGYGAERGTGGVGENPGIAGGALRN